MASRIRIEGLTELQARMKLLAADVRQKVAYQAVLAGAQIIKREAIRLAPEADDAHKIEGVTVPAGNLKKNIVNKRLSKRETNLAAEYVVTVRGKRKHGYASRYGSIQEFGSVKQAPQPFMRPAFDTQKEAAARKIVERLEARIDKMEKSGT